VRTRLADCHCICVAYTVSICMPWLRKAALGSDVHVWRPRCAALLSDISTGLQARSCSVPAVWCVGTPWPHAACWTLCCLREGAQWALAPHGRLLCFSGVPPTRGVVNPDLSTVLAKRRSKTSCLCHTCRCRAIPSILSGDSCYFFGLCFLDNRMHSLQVF
jgi:hypothetical protein